MISTYENAVVRIDGKPIAFTSLEWSRKDPDHRPAFPSRTYEASATMTIDGAWFADLMRALEAQRQLCNRLARRLMYGGRKARAAARRLRREVGLASPKTTPLPQNGVDGGGVARCPACYGQQLYSEETRECAWCGHEPR